MLYIIRRRYFKNTKKHSRSSSIKKKNCLDNKNNEFYSHQNSNKRELLKKLILNELENE